MIKLQLSVNSQEALLMRVALYGLSQSISSEIESQEDYVEMLRNAGAPVKLDTSMFNDMKKDLDAIESMIEVLTDSLDDRAEWESAVKVTCDACSCDDEEIKEDTKEEEQEQSINFGFIAVPKGNRNMPQEMTFEQFVKELLKD